MAEYDWLDTTDIEDANYICGYCGTHTAPGKQYITRHHNGRILICSNCSKPTFFADEIQIPKSRLGNQIQGISNAGLGALYNEARDCTAVGAYTAAVMVCCKILINLAIDQGAEEGKPFPYYVDFLTNMGYIPPKGKKWVDTIRKQGSEAAQEIALKAEKDAKLILDFTDALLRFNYELPNLLENDSQTDD